MEGRNKKSCAYRFICYVMYIIIILISDGIKSAHRLLENDENNAGTAMNVNN